MPEILFHIGDSGGNRDGDIISVKPNGVLFTSAEVVDYVQNATIPASFSQMPNCRQRHVKRYLMRLRWLLRHTAEEIEVEFPEVDLAGAVVLKTEAETDRDAILVDGLDTNWGFQDLKLFCAIRADITAVQAWELVDPDVTESHRPQLLGKRRWRVDYRSTFPLALIASLENQNERVEAIRSSTLPLNALTDAPR